MTQPRRVALMCRDTLDLLGVVPLPAELVDRLRHGLRCNFYLNNPEPMAVMMDHVAHLGRDVFATFEVMVDAIHHPSKKTRLVTLLLSPAEEFRRRRDRACHDKAVWPSDPCPLRAFWREIEEVITTGLGCVADPPPRQVTPCPPWISDNLAFPREGWAEVQRTIGDGKDWLFHPYTGGSIDTTRVPWGWKLPGTLTYPQTAKAQPSTTHTITITKSAAAVKDQAGLERWIAKKLDKQLQEKMQGALMGQKTMDATAAMSSARPSVPPAKRVLVEGYPMARVVNFSVLDRWVDVLVCGDDGEPIYDADKRQYRIERLKDVRVEPVPDRPK